MNEIIFKYFHNIKSHPFVANTFRCVPYKHSHHTVKFQSTCMDVFFPLLICCGCSFHKRENIEFLELKKINTLELYSISIIPQYRAL